MAQPPSYNDAIAPRQLNLPVFNAIQGKRVILASASPRRKMLLNQMGLKDFEVVVSEFEEDLDKSSMSAYEYVRETAIQKALSVYKKEVENGNEPELLIAADTIIVSKNQVIEKPKNPMHHFNMLQSLRDDPFPHRVFTAVVCIAPLDEPVYPGYNLQLATEETQVFFDKSVSDEFLSAYVATGESVGSAGGYSIQGMGALLIDKIVGDYSNVVGLPLKTTLKLMEKTLFPEEEDFENV
ncbi:Maf-like protein [Dipodascopsis uninucleata]